MKKLLLAVFLATPLLAQDPVIREALPSDYKPSPCAADTAWVCEPSISQQKMSAYAAVARKYNLPQEWINAHWDEMIPLFQPICAKIASCFTIKDNDWVWCVDLSRPEFLATCQRFPEGSYDNEQCRMFALTYFLGLPAKAEQARQSKECMSQQPPSGERTMVAWIEPQTYGPDYNGELRMHTYDSETHIPVRAQFVIDGGTLTPAEGPIAMTGTTSRWKAGYKRVPNARGHRDIVSPTATIQATNYKSIALPIALPVPTVTVAMTPEVTKLKAGKNTIAITAIDDSTGKPARLRIMAGTRVLGNTNEPVELELEKGAKRPEIWLTSLYDRYSDIVIAPAQ